MEKRQFKSKHWWRVLLLLFVCLFAGSSGLRAGVHFSDAGMMTVEHNPTLEQPYIVVDVLYFDAYGGDGYFTTATTEGNHEGAAVYVNGNYICSPTELTWNGNQSGANNWRDKNSWAGTTYNQNGAVVRFYDPRHEASSGAAEDRYRVHMYIFLQNWEAGAKYTVKVKGTWKINAKNGVPGSEEVEEQVVQTAAFPNPWSAPTKALMTNYNTVSVSGNLSTAYGPTMVGFDTGTTLPTAFNSSPSSKQSYTTQDGTTSSYADQVCSGFNIEGTSSDNYRYPRKLNVQYSFVVTHSYCNNYNMTVYKWYSTSVTGFAYPQNLSFETTNQWTKKVKVNWGAYTATNRSTNGTWTITDKDNKALKSNLSAASRSAEITLPDDYEYDTNYNVKVYFVPKGYTSTTVMPYNMSSSVTTKITPVWNFDKLEAEEILTGDDDGKVKLTWTFPQLEDASSNKPYNFSLLRSTDNQEFSDLKDNNNNTVVVPVTDNTKGVCSFVDKTVEASRTYYYKVKLNVFGEDKLSDFVQIRSGGSKIKSFSATRGSYSNLVKLQWSITLVGSSANFIIQRRPLGSNNDREWADIYTTTGSATNYSYDDVTALPGSFNEYKVIVWSQDGTTWNEDDAKTTDGFSLTTGMVSGNITYGTGTAVEGAKVTLKQQTVDGDIASGMHSLLLSGVGTGLKYAADTDVLKELFKGDFSIQMYLDPNGDAMATNDAEYQLVYVAGALDVKLKYVVGEKQVTEITEVTEGEGDEQTTSYVPTTITVPTYNYYLSGTAGGTTITSSTLPIPASEWSHLSLVYTVSDKKLTAYLTKDDETQSTVLATTPTGTDAGADTDFWEMVTADCFVIGNNNSLNATNTFNGNIDEFRFFTKALTEKEILRNYNHPLAGNESSLTIYYPLDEGIPKQTIAYDFSRKNGISNGRHAQVKAVTSDNVPSENLLSLMAYTDANGYYEIRGVPFLGEGTSYSVIPTLGIHEFSPVQQSRYVSMSTLNHSGVNFEDVSSFPVSGRVFYAGSDYPVEGVNFYVDGNICAKDGEVIQTNADGEFTISVPIGDHFITVKKNGHVFANEGRYPADAAGVGTRHTFDRELKNMEFVDETLVNFTGRVVGGSIQGDKAVGFGLSENNIGKTQLVLTPLNTNYRMNVKRVEDGTTFSYDINNENAPIASATDRIASRAWRGSGTMDLCKKIFIQTDPNTGEFSAMLPPLEFNIATITLVGIDTDNELEGSATSIDLTNPLLEYNDTLHNDDGTDVLYPYNTMMKYVYHSVPTFIVTQEDHYDENTKTNDGAFGIKSYEFQEGANNTVFTVNDFYTIVDGTPVYKYGKGDDTQGAAVFVMDDSYTWNIEAYEEYTNVDKTGVTDHVPLAGVVVTIGNALSDQQPIINDANLATADALAAAGYEGNGSITNGQVAELQSNQLKLDDEGKGVYTWTAGLPNVTAPFTRTVTITYDIESRTYQWSGSGMKGIVLGTLPTGNDFVTSGPDVVDMILRDPPGSGSYAEWTSGTITNLANEVTAHFSSETGLNTTTKLGVTAVTCSGVGVAVINSMEAENDMTLGAKVKVENEGGHKWSRSVEATKAISTSDSPDYVGADADVFIGSATNIIFGAARSVDFRHNDNDEIVLNVKDVISTGLSFGTMFNYTQGYIKYELLPKLKKNRNALLVHVNSIEEMNSYVNSTDNPVYLTLLTPDDPEYGSNNNDRSVWGTAATDKGYEGPSYKMVVPESGKNKKNYEDKVAWHNNQIASWKSYLKQNEQQKVAAFNKRMQGEGDYKNFSFDAGAKINNTVETVDTHGGRFSLHGEAIVNFGMTWGVEFDDSGVLFDATNETTYGLTEAFEGSKGEKTVFSYTLADGDAGDALTVDVYDYGGFGPIFRTRGGQTSAPYEGKVVTEYYEPGTTIMEPTLQIEVPQIGVDISSVSDVPTGSAAAYTLRLGNASEANKDVTYRLSVLDTTNPNGAVLSVDGQVLTESRLINVPAGQTLKKTLQLRQGSEDILDYTDIGLQFASVSQPGDINSVVYISAQFAASSSPVTLETNKTLMNTTNGTDLRLTFKDFDRNYKNLKAFRLQYLKQGATDWTQLKEYVLGTPTGNQLALPEMGSSVSYTLPMASFSDGEYMFRVVSASTNGNEEVYRYSNEIALVKDMQRPTPLGQPEPADGILDIGDDLSVTFNEIIMKGELTKVANFKVTGVLNGAPVSHMTALSMQNTEKATAATEASINLAGKDFAFDMWVNLKAGGGTLLSQGNGSAKFTISTDASDRLVVNIGNQTYTSEKSVPTGKWAFLTLSYKNTETGCLLNASVADDANTTNLFVDLAVVSYNGNGPLAVGKEMTGAIHELLLWDEAHDLTTALLNRSYTKKPSTRHLIGYWKMDEGEGKEIRDYSRNRHMIMTDATWYLNNANKAVTLDGGHFVSIDASQLPVCVDDDYAVEFWMRGASQSDAQLLQMGEIALWVKADGTLQLTGKGAYDSEHESVLATSATSLTDNAWHHVALNVLRQGSAAVYVDGKRCLTTSASNVGSITTNNLIVGARRVTESAELGTYSFARPFTGLIDEVRVWNATMNGDLLTANRKVRLTGGEDGLVAYYPFETQTLDEGNQVVAVGSAADLTGSSLTAQLKTLALLDATLEYTDEAPAMRQKPTETNVSFTFVASNEKVVITIDEDPATIEGCTLNFTVRDVCDENGNYSVPAVWSAYVNRNELVWADDALTLTQPVRTESSVTATIVNKSGKQQMWTLSGLPSWLTASAEYGTTNPLGETDVTFTVSESTPVGNYEETIYLAADNGIETPLTLHVKVTGNVPDWAVDINAFESSMNVIGRLDILNVESEDEDDIVAAFVGEECRGVAHPVYNKRYDRYFVTMDIYGNADEVVTFRAYDASAGIIYPIVDVNGAGVTSITFEPLALKGSYNVPTALVVEDKIEQTIPLAKGWNWIALGVSADDMKATTLFADVAKDVEQFKGHSQNDPILNYATDHWVGSNADTPLSNTKMYAVKMAADRTLRLVGQRLDPASNSISLATGWNWIGYYGLQVSSVTDALAGMTPTNGELIKGQRGVAYYDTYEWSGSLVTLVPGQGYVVQSSSSRSFCYPAKSVAAWAPGRDIRGAEAVAAEAVTAGADGSFSPVDYHMYSSNMVLVTRVEMDGQPLCGVELGIFAGDECRSTVTTNDEGIAFVLIPGDDPVTLSFKVAIAGTMQGETTQTIEYNNDDIIGTSNDPFVITLNPTGIDAIEAMGGEAVWYDLSGRRLEAAPVERGIYVVTVCADGRIATHLVRR